MFEQLFGSKTRVKLLSLFLNNPNRSFYVREITRKIDEQINSVRRELSNLLSIGLIKSETSQNRLYYEVNQRYPHYQELARIFSHIPIKRRKSAEPSEEDQLAKKLRGSGTVEMAFLTGYFVRDNNSPIDIFIMGDVNRAKVAKIIGDIEQEIKRELNYVVMTPDDYTYRSDLNDRFLAMIMDSKKIMLVEKPDRQTVPVQVAEESGEA